MLHVGERVGRLVGLKCDVWEWLANEVRVVLVF